MLKKKKENNLLLLQGTQASAYQKRSPDTMAYIIALLSEKGYVSLWQRTSNLVSVKIQGNDYTPGIAGLGANKARQGAGRQRVCSSSFPRKPWVEIMILQLCQGVG